MKRRLFNLLAGVSLVLSISLIVVTIRSFWVTSRLQKSNWNPLLSLMDAKEIDSTNGGISLYAGTTWYMWHGEPVVVQFYPKWDFAEETIHSENRRWVGLWAFHFSHRSGILTDTHWSNLEVKLPYGPLILLLLVSPAIWILRAWRVRRPGICKQCGYDLRGTPSRCPECGTIVAVSPQN